MGLGVIANTLKIPGNFLKNFPVTHSTNNNNNNNNSDNNITGPILIATSNIMKIKKSLKIQKCKLFDKRKSLLTKKYF